MISNTVIVASGKGGVGKSTVCIQLALALVNKRFKVAILDIDLTGPSIPTLLNITNANVLKSPNGWIPVSVTPLLSAMSIAFLLENKDDAVVWRGPKKNAMIKQFLHDVCWGDIDYLLIDTPPGTSDEHISIAEYLQDPSFNLRGAVMITTPQAVSLIDVKKEISFCQKVGIPVLGIVENMSGFICPHCAECSDLFSSGGGEAMANDLQIPFLARVPIDPTISCQNLVDSFQNSPLSSIFDAVCTKIFNKPA